METWVYDVADGREEGVPRGRGTVRMSARNSICTARLRTYSTRGWMWLLPVTENKHCLEHCADSKLTSLQIPPNPVLNNHSQRVPQP